MKSVHAQQQGGSLAKCDRISNVLSKLCKIAIVTPSRRGAPLEGLLSSSFCARKATQHGTVSRAMRFSSSMAAEGSLGVSMAQRAACSDILDVANRIRTCLGKGRTDPVEFKDVCEITLGSSHRCHIVATSLLTGRDTDGKSNDSFWQRCCDGHLL